MSVASLFEPVRGYDRTRVVPLVEKLVQSCRDDYARLKEYEAAFSPSLADAKDDNAAVEVFRSIWELYAQWARDAEQVLAHVDHLKSGGHMVPGANQLFDDYAGVRARLNVKPERIVTAMQQLRRGEGIRVEVLRDELRRRRGA